jgi:4-hydroxybenzoate polyprenyltransferase
MALLAAAGNAHNDLLDLPVDRVNRPDRPLPSGRLSPRTAAWTAGFFYALSFALAFVLGKAAGNLAIGMGILLAFYNLRLKHLPLLGNLAVALLCALAVYLPELPKKPVYTGIPFLFAFLTTVARELAKDAEDMPGDRSAGWRTFPLAFGEGATRALVAALLIATLMLLPYPALAMEYHPLYAFAAGVPGALLVWLLALALRAAPPWGRIQRRLKWTMLAGMLALLVGVRL